MLFFKIILPVVFSLGLNAHDFKMSVCEIAYSTENEAFDVKFYLFQDDLKSALYHNPNAPAIEEKKASDYILQHFAMSVNGQDKELAFQSMKGKNDQVLVHFTTQKIPLSSLSKLQVKNNLLLEKFGEQINMVYALLPGQDKLVQMLNATRTEAEFSL